MATGFVWHELYMWHNTWNWAQVFAPSLTIQPGEHAENPETKRRLRNLLDVSGLLDKLVSETLFAAARTDAERAEGVLAGGNLTLLHRDPAISSLHPIPIRPRSRPAALANHVNWSGSRKGR